MKKYKDNGVYDFSDYAEEITGNALFSINGGAQIENSVEAQANAQVGDTITRNDGTTVTITQGDINWAQQQLAAGATGVTSSGNSGSGSQGVTGNTSVPSSSGGNNKTNNLRDSGYPSSKEGIKKNDILPSELTESNELLKNEKEVQKQPLWQLSFGDRKAAIIGAGYSIGIVINPNNLWDSGVKVSAEDDRWF